MHVAAAIEARGDVVDVDDHPAGHGGRLAAEADLGELRLALDEEHAHLHRRDAHRLVDESRQVVDARAGLLEILAREPHDGHAAAAGVFERTERAAEHLRAAGRIALLDHPVERVLVDAAGEEPRGQLEDAVIGAAEAEPAGVGGQSGEHGLGNRAARGLGGRSERDAEFIDDAHEHLRAAGAPRRHDPRGRHVVAARVMVDADHQLRVRLEPVAAVLELAPRAGVDHHGQVTAVLRRHGAAVHVSIFAWVRQAQDRAIDRAGEQHVHLRTQRAQRTGKRQHRAEGVAVRLEVRGDARPLRRAQAGDELGIGHGGFVGHLAGAQLTRARPPVRHHGAAAPPTHRGRGTSTAGGSSG